MPKGRAERELAINGRVEFSCVDKGESEVVCADVGIFQAEDSDGALSHLPTTLPNSQ